MTGNYETGRRPSGEDRRVMESGKRCRLIPWPEIALTAMYVWTKPQKSGRVNREGTI